MRTVDEFEWNDAAIAQLRALWAAGVLAREIGERLGVSKNAVVGKAHRLNLPSRPSPIRREPDYAGAGRRRTKQRVGKQTLQAPPSLGFPPPCTTESDLASWVGSVASARGTTSRHAA